MASKVPDQDLPVAVRHDVYPTIDPEPHFSGQTYKGKVVFVTGASRGIGKEIATFYAQAGASVVLTARNQATLDDVRASILSLAPAAEVLTVPVDVTQPEQVQGAVKAAVDRFGRLDICVSNAGLVYPADRPIAKEDADRWWKVMEVNLRGTFNTAQSALPHLSETKGYFIAIGSAAAQYLLPNGSAYILSKHALNRFVEFVALENPSVKAMSVHPGAVMTALGMENPQFSHEDTAQLSAATVLYLTSGKADWFSGRYVSANWDLGEVERDWKDKIIESQALVNRLAVPL
ncbi:hypothetical protein EWM64_g9001 [Hericium alpestre]|uniref:Ketoreductase domain-containing protein n=1 Tax=Hericium alpestre TaxID=135208 RepID=A0A4Y9ZM22_9AGAM|nr:hypothetical protein EWM64_g9001 [Hericium alpestre]